MRTDVLCLTGDKYRPPEYQGGFHRVSIAIDLYQLYQRAGAGCEKCRYTIDLKQLFIVIDDDQYAVCRSKCSVNNGILFVAHGLLIRRHSGLYQVHAALKQRDEIAGREYGLNLVTKSAS